MCDCGDSAGVIAVHISKNKIDPIRFIASGRLIIIHNNNNKNYITSKYLVLTHWRRCWYSIFVWPVPSYKSSDPRGTGSPAGRVNGKRSSDRMILRVRSIAHFDVYLPLILANPAALILFSVIDNPKTSSEKNACAHVCICARTDREPLAVLNPKQHYNAGLTTYVEEKKSHQCVCVCV